MNSDYDLGHHEVDFMEAKVMGCLLKILLGTACYFYVQTIQCDIPLYSVFHLHVHI